MLFVLLVFRNNFDKEIEDGWMLRMGRELWFKEISI